jgi:hypothetical protein
MRENVHELMRTPDGRAYLKRMQDRHKLDLLQPSDPMFDKVYGDRNRKVKEELEKQETQSKDMWLENKERREREVRI